MLFLMLLTLVLPEYGKEDYFPFNSQKVAANFPCEYTLYDYDPSQTQLNFDENFQSVIFKIILIYNHIQYIHCSAYISL